MNFQAFSAINVCTEVIQTNFSMSINKQNFLKEGKGNKKFTGRCNHCRKMGHEAANCCGHALNEDKRPKNWIIKSDMEVGAPNIKVLLGCTENNMIKSRSDRVLINLDLWKLALKKLEEILVLNKYATSN